MKKVHYMTFPSDFDYPGIDFDAAAGYIYKKLNSINSYIKDNIDKEVTLK